MCSLLQIFIFRRLDMIMVVAGLVSPPREDVVRLLCKRLSLCESSGGWPSLVVVLLEAGVVLRLGALPGLCAD